MIDGALVLPPIRVGMMEASTTRNPSTPTTRNYGIDNRSFIGTHPDGPDRMINGVRTVAQNGANVIVRANILAVHLRRTQFCKRLCIHDTASHLEALCPSLRGHLNDRRISGSISGASSRIGAV